MSTTKPDTVIDDHTNSGSNPSTVIDILRHGELEGGDIFRGSTNDALTDNGWQQMVNALDNKNDWDIIITSPILGCREFAEVIAQEEEIDLEINKQLEEIDFGEWENKTPDEIMKQDNELLSAWCQSPTQTTPPAGEDFYDFKARVFKAFKEIKQQYKGKKILIITHSGVIRTLLMSTLGIPDENLFSLNVDYASFSQIKIDHHESSERGILIAHR